MKSPIIKKISAFILTAILTLFLIDIFLVYSKIAPPILKYFHPEYGALNTPNIDYMKSREGLFLGKSNYDGRFRENYPKRKKNKNTLRILLIGDSFVEGIDVFSRNHFASYMEALLTQKLGRPVEVLDFGRGNCTIQASSYYFINYIQQEYDGDLVLYFTEARDINSATDFPSTSFILDTTTQKLISCYDWKNGFDYKLSKKLDDLGLLKICDNSGVFRLAYRVKGGIEMYGFLTRVFGKFYGEIKPQSYKEELIEGEISPTTEAVYDTLNTYKNGKVIFVVRNFPLKSTYLENYFTSKKLSYISLADTLEGQLIKNTQDNAYFFKTTGMFGGHWNHKGHKAVGHFLSNRIVNEIKKDN